MKMKNILFVALMAVLFAACGTSKSVQNNGSTQQASQGDGGNSAQQSLNYIRKVNDNSVYAKNISAKIDLTISGKGKQISTNGKLQMRKDEVVRIIAIDPFLGLMEVGRLEFTPEYVLLVNRIEKQFVKATYSDLDFLKDNGLDFYTLQSLFWNQMFVPGKKELLDADLAKFSTDMKTAPAREICNESGKLSFVWNTNVEMARIDNAEITYAKDTPKASSMSFNYSDFVPMGSKRFPSKIELAFRSKAADNDKMSLRLELGKISDDASWEARTNVAEKYSQVSAQELFGKLMNM